MLKTAIPKLGLGDHPFLKYRNGPSFVGEIYTSLQYIHFSFELLHFLQSFYTFKILLAFSLIVSQYFDNLSTSRELSKNYSLDLTIQQLPRIARDRCLDVIRRSCMKMACYRR